MYIIMMSDYFIDVHICYFSPALKKQTQDKKGIEGQCASATSTEA